MGMISPDGIVEEHSLHLVFAILKNCKISRRGYWQCRILKHFSVSWTAVLEQHSISHTNMKISCIIPRKLFQKPTKWSKGKRISPFWKFKISLVVTHDLTVARSKWEWLHLATEWLGCIETPANFYCYPPPLCRAWLLISLDWAHTHGSCLCIL